MENNDELEMTEEEKRAFAKAYKLIIEIGEERERRIREEEALDDEPESEKEEIQKDQPIHSDNEKLQAIIADIEHLTFEELCELDKALRKIIARKAAEGFEDI